MTKVTSLHIYPLKGGRGIQLDEVALGTFGPRDDRRWMVIDREGVLVTQREIPILCQVDARPSPADLTLAAPGRSDFTVLRPDSTAPTRPVRIWNDIVEAVDLGDESARWCSDFLGDDVRLVYFPDTTRRRTDTLYDKIGAHVGFADGYPLLVIGEESLVDLNRRLDVPLPMNRFRPNVVVAGAEPFAEDTWLEFTIGAIRFEGLKLCARCPVTTTNQETGERLKEPLKTLATFRKRPGGVMFGMNVSHRGLGTIRVGDEVDVQRIGQGPSGRTAA